jgi:plastocyanin
MAFHGRVLGAAALAAGLVAGAWAAEQQAGGGAEIHIDNFAFTPAETTVAAGTKVTWLNRDDIPHTVVESKMTFRSKALDTDQTFSFTFTAPGTYSYFCSLHPHMKGTVIVK